jgi:hypothetical protein
VLRPRGLLALLWNRRKEDDPIHKGIDPLIEPYRGDTPHHRAGAWRTAFERTTLFDPLEEAEFDSEQRLDADELEARIASISYIAALDPSERAPLLERVRALAGDGQVVLPYRTEVHVTRRR